MPLYLDNYDAEWPWNEVVDVLLLTRAALREVTANHTPDTVARAREALALCEERLPYGRAARERDQGGT